MVVRVYNTSDARQEGRPRLPSPHVGAEMLDLNEESLGPADVHGGWVKLSARSNQIVNVKFGTA